MWATAFQSINTGLIKQTRSVTIQLYRSLLRSSKKYDQKDQMQKTIRQKFRLHKANTSRPRVLELLNEAGKIDWHLKKDNEQTKQLVNQYFLDHPEKKPWVQLKKKRKYTKRKPYQVPLIATHSSGYQFKRIRGWKQPVKISMIIKKFTKKVQKRGDRFNELAEFLEMGKRELQFEKSLNLKSYVEWIECNRHTIKAMDYNHRKNIKTKRIEPEKIENETDDSKSML